MIGGGADPRLQTRSLLVALLDPASRKPVLQLRIDKPIDTSPATAEAVINAAVTELFTKYPTRTAKP